jgi:deoxyribodipyrimidine photo-lyase
MTTALVWFRQDLRLLDNPALTAALAGADTVIPLFVLPDDLGGAARWWLHHSLTALAAALAARGAALVLRRGPAASALAALVAETGASAVHATICPEPSWRAADAELAERLEGSGARLHRHWQTLFEPDSIRTKTGGLYGMFTPFANTLRAMGAPPRPVKEPDRIPGPTRAPASDALASWRLLPTKPDWATEFGAMWSPGEATARAVGRAFVTGPVAAYDTARNIPGIVGTSMLSAHLHWGEISGRALWHALHRKALGPAERVFEGELIWREFAQYLLWHRPHLPDAPLRPEFAGLPWRQAPGELAAWQHGRTGVPIVDAGMRQLWRTGWMHNRVRMIVASFLTKHLLIDWRRGAAWFMDTLVDADLSANSMNWQWTAGTGIDAQPFFRVFNPVSQGEKFDPDGAYVRRFVPEVAQLPDKFLHAPWTAPPMVARAAGVALGQSYPLPLVDLAVGRERALAVYKASVRGGAEAA